MKYIKSFENLEQFNVGDYVIIKSKYFNGELKNFVENNIGVVIKKGFLNCRVNFDYRLIPTNILVNFHIDDNGKLFLVFDNNEIILFSNNKNDLQIKIDSNKYNL